MDKDLLTIRKVKLSDAKDWFTLINRVWRDTYHDIFPEEVFLEKEKKLEENIKTFSNKFYNNSKTIAYVVEYDGKIIGVMSGNINSQYDYFHSDYADLSILYIDSNYQGYGIGTKLKNIFQEWAIINGASKYVIGVLKDNIKARKVYESWGGKLSNYEQDLVKLEIGYPEVFYIYDLKRR